MKGLHPGFVISVLLGTFLLAGCDITRSISVPDNAHWSHGKGTINGDISIGSGAVVDGDMSTINGDVHAATGAHVGKLTTVNGDISVDHDARTGELTDVNGNIQLGQHVAANGNVTTVNGDIQTGNGAHIQGDITDVNGNIALCAVKAEGDLRFVNGTLLIKTGSEIKGSVIAKKPKFDSSDELHEPVMIVGPHAIVDGSITFERPGKLYLSDSAVIHAVNGVTPEKFSGTVPSGVTAPDCADN